MGKAIEKLEYVYAVYIIQTTGSLKHTKSNEAYFRLDPAYVVFSEKEAEHACESSKRAGLLAFYLKLGVRRWSDSTIRSMRKQRQAPR